ncbi:MAG: ATP-binding cassette domain-containing protein, partial [Cyanophyceae cyanobacterium]
MVMEPTVVVRQLNHFYGEGSLRRQILFDIDLEILSGEIVIMTGPSGAGKTTLLTLIGGLRKVQYGELQVLGQTMRDVGNERLKKVRRQIGFIFQEHNLLSSLNALRNVEMAAALYPISWRESEQRSKATLGSVGLENYVYKFPNELSGGQKQRVAIARALVNQPQIILADEPTASLDGETGREVVDLMQKLAKQQGCTIILVTHDNRILDIADRIINLEDGHLATDLGQFVFSLSDLTSLVSDISPDVIFEMILPLSTEQFSDFLTKLNGDLKDTLNTTSPLRDRPLESKLQIMLQAIALKIAQILKAEQVTFFVVDHQRQILWSKNARGKNGKPTNIEIPMGAGIAGYVATTGETVHVGNPYGDMRFNPQVDFETEWVTRNILCLPLMDENNRVFAVVQALNRLDGASFDDGDEERFLRLTRSLKYTVQSSIVDAQKLYSLMTLSTIRNNNRARTKAKKIRSKVVALSLEEFAVLLENLNDK